MEAKVGVIDFEHLLQPGIEPEWFKGLRRYLPKNVDVLLPKTSRDILEFIDKHQRLVVLDAERSSGREPMVYGEVAYWAQCTGGNPEKIIVLETQSQEGKTVAAEVLKCLH